MDKQNPNKATTTEDVLTKEPKFKYEVLIIGKNKKNLKKKESFFLWIYVRMIRKFIVTAKESWYKNLFKKKKKKKKKKKTNKTFLTAFKGNSQFVNFIALFNGWFSLKTFNCFMKTIPWRTNV